MRQQAMRQQATDTFDFTAEEQETFVNWDYSAQVVHFYTTRRTTFEKLASKVKGMSGISVNKADRTVTVPIRYVRQPYSLFKSKNAKCHTN